MKRQLLSTERIVLRAPEPEDLEVMYRMENLPEMWAVSNATVPYSRYVLRRYIENCRNDIYADRELRLMIQTVEGHRVVGTVDLVEFTPLHGRAEAGIAILEEYRRKGYAREALELMCHYVFRQLGLNQLYAYVAVDNEASLALFESCGFTRKVELRDWLCYERAYKNVYLLQCFATSYV